MSWPLGVSGLKPEVLIEVCRLLISGRSLRRVMFETGVAYGTVRKYRNELLALGELPNCACGKPPGHSGFCKWRVILYGQFRYRQSRVKARARAKLKGVARYPNGRIKRTRPDGKPIPTTGVPHYG